MQKIQDLIADKWLDRDRVIENVTAQKANIFLWVPFFIAVGIGFYFSFKSEPSLSVVLWAWLVSALSLGVWWQLRRDNLFHKIILYLIAGAFLIASGFAAAKIRSEMVYTPMVIKKINTAMVEGTVVEVEPLDKGLRMILENLHIERIKPTETPRKIRITVKQETDIKAGQRLKFLAGLNPPSPPVAPNAFDFQRHAYFQGIGGVGFAYGAPDIIDGQADQPLLQETRRKITSHITQATTMPAQGVIIALMTGQRKLINEEKWEAMRASGLAHMLAISGLHVGMVAGVLFFFSRLFMAAIPPLALKYPIKKYAALFALLGTFLYMLIVGAPIPTQRAMIMTGLALLAICFDRSPFSLRLVAFAATIILLYRPESLVSVSFQMSFAAVTALVAFFDATRPYWRNFYSRAGVGRKILLYFIGLSCTTLIAGAVTGIFALYHFQHYAAYGLLANLMAVPILSIIVMPLVVLAYVLIPLGLSPFLFSVIEYGVEWILAIASWVARLDGAVWHMPVFPNCVFILMVVTLWLWAVWNGAQKRIIFVTLVLLFGLTLLVKQPDIQFSSDGKLIAIRTDNGSLWLSTKQNNRYTAENWLRANGTPHAYTATWPREGEDQNFPLHCDPSGCRGEMKGRQLAVSFLPKGIEEDCQWADMVIATHDVDWKKCRDPVLIDYWDTWREGAHAVWFMKNNIVVINVEGERGKRLWTQTAANYHKQKSKN